MELLNIIFITLLSLTLHSFLFYPLLLSLISSFFHRKGGPGQIETPSITLIVSAYNEEKIIEKKLLNCLRLEYPRERLQVMVVSDCSTDDTDSIVKNFTKVHNVVLLQQPARKGKSAGLNHAVEKASGELLVFSDADAMYPQEAIRQIVTTLCNPTVGLVTGTTRYLAEGETGIAETSGLYTQLERFIKRHESRIGSCVGADGAIFAMRKSLYRPLRNDDINDLVIPLSVVRQGYRVVLDEALYCLEPSSCNLEAEFRRQIRITNRTLRAIFSNRDLMNVFRYRFFSLEIISHKLIRLSVPLFMVLLFPINLLLLENGLIYKVIFSSQLAFYFFAALGSRQGSTNVPFGLAYHFALINISILIGWWNFLRGEKQTTWNQ